MFSSDDEDDDFSMFAPQMGPQAASPLPGANPLAPADPSAAPMPLPSPNPLAPAAAPPPMNPMVKDYLAKKFDLGNFTQANRDKIEADNAPGLGDRGLAALASLGAGFMGRDAAAAGQGVLGRAKQNEKDKLEQFDKGRADKIQDYAVGQQQTKDERENEQFDPNSAASQNYRKIIEASFPKIAGSYGDGWKNVSASDAQLILKPLQLKENTDARKLQAAMLANDKEYKHDIQKRETDNKDAMALTNHLTKGWAARGGQAAVAQGKINSAEAAEALLEQAKTQDGGLDSRQIEELAQSTGRLLGGGTQASGRIEALVPKTWLGRTQSLKEYLSSKPQGQDMQDFTDRMAETIAREKALATKQKQDFQKSGLAAHSRFKASNPDLYNQILQDNGLTDDVLNGKKEAPSIVKQERNKKTGETRVTYSDGHQEIIPNTAGN